MTKLTVFAPAKLNLTLDVLGRRPDGYHELDMLMQAVTLYETVTLEKSASLTLTCRAANGALSPDIPTDERNLAFRAARLFFESTGLSGGAVLTVCKAVPSRAGMAGGSADAAGVLVGLNRLYAAGLSSAELCALGAQLGSDVPFCLAGGTARVRGRGELVEPAPAPPPCFFTVVMPPEGTPTASGFARYDRDGVVYPPATARALGLLANGDIEALGACLFNALQPACAGEKTGAIVSALRCGGARAALMTGSGAAVYGVFTRESAAAAAAETLKKSFSPVFVLRPETRGPFVLREE